MTHPDLDKLEDAIEAYDKSPVMNGVDLLDVGYTETIVVAARAHLAAQRQGGDADYELFNLLADIARHKDAMPEAPYKTADMETWSHKKQSLVSRVWETVNWTRYHPTRETVRKALKSHPPAVTGDRDAAAIFMEKANIRDAVFTADEFETIRAALLSAQAGVPSNREFMRRLVDVVWTEATEGKGGFLGTPERDALIDKALNTNDGRE